MPVYALPSLRQPESISPHFYFTSQAFIKRALADIDRLLADWLKASSSASSSSRGEAAQKPPNRLGPFLTFKAIYARLGWTYMHLSVVDPALRKAWFNTLVRLFLDLFKPEVEPLKQIGALFALWCFWGTQPEVLGPKHYLVVDTDMCEYIRTIATRFSDDLDLAFDGVADRPAPTNASNGAPRGALSLAAAKHRAHLDPNLFGPPPPPVRPSESLVQVLANLTSQHAFVVEPSQIALRHPSLPTNTLVPEALQHVAPQPPQPARPRPSPQETLVPELIVAAKEELARWPARSQPPPCDPAALAEVRSRYLTAKAVFCPAAAAAERPDALTQELLAEAIGMTRKVIQKTGPGLDHLLFPPRAATAASSEAEPEPEPEPALEAFFLVDEAKAIPELEDAMECLKKHPP